MKKLFTGTLLFFFPILLLGQSASNKYEPLLSAAQKANSDALVVLEDGDKVLEYYSNSESTKIQSMSVTKSVVGLAVAKLLSEGKIDSLNIPVAHYYHEWRQGQKDEITLRHLMNHTSGLQNVANANVEVNPASDVLQLGLCASVVNEPGTEFSYNNKAVNIITGIIKKVAGKPVDKYLQNKLFNPMNISDFTWGTDEAGNHNAMSGFGVHARDLAKLGQLVLQKGNWNGKQLIEEQWVEKLLAQGPPETRTYGLLWWRIPKEEKYVVGSEQIKEMRKSGLNDQMLAKVQALKGEYSSTGSLQKAFMEQFETKRAIHEVSKSHFSQVYSPLQKKLSGPTIGYKASGDGGQYLVVYPKQNIVAVRMVNVSEDYNPKTDHFSSFSQMLYSLGQD